jgi:hypothetical protein
VPKQKKKREYILTPQELDKLRPKPITLTITIPARAVPLFKAIGEFYGLKPEEFAAMSVVRFLISEEAWTRLDTYVNEVL